MCQWLLNIAKMFQQLQKIAKELEDIPTLLPNVAKDVKKLLMLNCNFLENIIFAVVRDRLYYNFL